MLYLIAHETIHSGPLPQPEIVATITALPELTRGIDLRKHLEHVAGKLGVTVFEIVAGDPTYMPGAQLTLNLQLPARKSAQVHQFPAGNALHKGKQP